MTEFGCEHASSFDWQRACYFGAVCLNLDFDFGNPSYRVVANSCLGFPANNSRSLSTKFFLGFLPVLLTYF